MRFISKLRKKSPVVMAAGGLTLMAGGTVALLAGAPPVPGLGPLEIIGAGWVSFMGSFAVPADAVRDTMDAKPHPDPLKANKSPEAGFSEGKKYELTDTDAARRWIEVIAFSVVAICAGGLSVAAYLSGDKAFAIIVVGVVFYVGFNRFFYWSADVLPRN